LRTMRQYGSAVAVDIRHGCGGSLVPCATQESLLKGLTMETASLRMHVNKYS
jgi:hypothetical protein